MKGLWAQTLSKKNHGLVAECEARSSVRNCLTPLSNLSVSAVNSSEARSGGLYPVGEKQNHLTRARRAAVVKNKLPQPTPQLGIKPP